MREIKSKSNKNSAKFSHATFFALICEAKFFLIDVDCFDVFIYLFILCFKDDKVTTNCVNDFVNKESRNG